MATIKSPQHFAARRALAVVQAVQVLIVVHIARRSLARVIRVRSRVARSRRSSSSASCTRRPIDIAPFVSVSVIAAPTAAALLVLVPASFVVVAPCGTLVARLAIPFKFTRVALQPWVRCQVTADGNGKDHNQDLAPVHGRCLRWLREGRPEVIQAPPGQQGERQRARGIDE